jgi:hypothetical protein
VAVDVDGERGGVVNVEFVHYVQAPSGEEEWRVNCDVEGVTNAAHVDLNFARCGFRELGAAEFLAYCEANGGAPDITAHARDVMLSRRAGGVG